MTCRGCGVTTPRPLCYFCARTPGLARKREIRCAAWMPQNREPCARYIGHRDEHRSRYALDNAAWMRNPAFVRVSFMPTATPSTTLARGRETEHFRPHPAA